MSVRAKTWTRDEYARLVATGALAPGARLQLVQGEIVEMTPQSAAHAAAIRKCRQALEAAFGPAASVDVQLPIVLAGSDSVPEPDLSVVIRRPDAYREAHPSSALLVVEVADTSLDYDRTRKQAAYATGGLPEYWLLNLIAGVLEVYRDPAGSAYRTRLMLRPPDVATPLAAPGASVRVASLLP